MDGSHGRPKAWWTEIDDELYDNERHDLRTAIHGGNEVEPLTMQLTPHDRFRA